MQVELEVVRFNIKDIVTTSGQTGGCAQPDVPTDVGGDLVVCPAAFI